MTPARGPSDPGYSRSAVRMYLTPVDSRTISNKIDALSGAINKSINDQNLTNAYALLGALSSFFAMLALFFFTSLDFIHLMGDSHKQFHSEIIKNVGWYLYSGIFEMVSAGLCGFGILWIKTKKTDADRYFFIAISILLGIIGVILFFIGTYRA